MRQAFIVSPVRTPVGTFGGALRSVSVEQLGATVAQAVLQRSGVDPERMLKSLVARAGVVWISDNTRGHLYRIP